MSKRYGRQQKRKHKALIEELQKQVANVSRDISVAKNIIDVAYKICPNSICFEPAKINQNTWEFRGHSAMIVNLNPWDHGGESAGIQIDARAINLYQLEAELRGSGFADAIHFEASLWSEREGGYRSAYRISKEGIKYVSKDRTTRELAEHLVGQVI